MVPLTGASGQPRFPRSATVEVAILSSPISSGSRFPEWAEEVSHIQNKRDKDIPGNELLRVRHGQGTWLNVFIWHYIQSKKKKKDTLERALQAISYCDHQGV